MESPFLLRAKRIVLTIFGGRPIWMNLLMLFCGYMTFVYMPWDLFVKPVAVDQEVWFGILLTGWAAKATEPAHWAVYAAGTYGFWKMRPWMWPWASVYVAQIAFSMFVWQLLDERASGLLGGTVSATPFVILTVMLWRARNRFSSAAANLPEDEEPDST
jgi:hypothetical protein|tara:strand:+ start:18926 stop:19402 length:477 start_codon:yes stop_codon:yes gene_type:complete